MPLQVTLFELGVNALGAECRVQGLSSQAELRSFARSLKLRRSWSKVALPLLVIGFLEEM